MGKKATSMVLTAIALFLIFLWLQSHEWNSTENFHTLMETVATLLALLVGIKALIRYYAMQDKKFLFIGAGFLGTAFLDAFHTLVTSSWIIEIFPSLPGSLQAWTWQSSRIFLALLMLATWRVGSDNSRKSLFNKASEKSVFISLGIVTFFVLAFFTLVPLPPPYYPQLPIGRPQELISGALFLVAFTGFFRAKTWQTNSFEFWLTFSMLVNFICQVLFMSSSYHFYDDMHVTAHLLKITGYAFVLTGLLINVHQLLENVVLSSGKITLTNTELQNEIGEKFRAESKLKDLAVSLEEKVSERTVELEESRLAALNMMEDANEAKKAAEAAKEELDLQAKKLVRSNKELEQFAYVASHDLQEPLRTVGSFVQLLAQRYQGKLDGQADEFIQFAVDGVSRMRQLINDLLVFSRVETKGGQFVPTDCELVLGEVLSNLKASIEASEARITHDPMPMIKADKVQLSQVFQNLIGNAIKFKGKNAPVIHIGVNEQNDDWLFSVKDNGIGFDPEFSEKVFIIFQRLHTREEYPGTGIGLSLCKKIIERHGGKIWVDSAPEKGSTFNFTIPDKMRKQDEYSSIKQTNRNSVG